MATVKAELAAESHPDLSDTMGSYHWVFSPECLDQIAEKVKGVPVTVNFSGEPIGFVTSAERTDNGVLLTMDVEKKPVERVASPAFRATADEWSEDYRERVINSVDLDRISFTKD